MNVAEALPTGGTVLQEEIPAMLTETLVLSFAILLPLTLSIGILVTFRVAGPVFRFEQHLGQIARGEAVGPCRIRKGDEFQELCIVINEAVDHLSESRDVDSPESEEGTGIQNRAA